MKFFGQEFVYVILKACRGIEKRKQSYLIFKMNVLNLKSYLLFIALSYPHLVIGASEIQLSKFFCPA